MGWNVKQIGADVAHANGHSGTGAVVAIIGTGIDLDHPDLDPVEAGPNFNNPDASSDDDNGHGSHVAGIVAARDATGNGFVGVAPGATLLPVKVLDRNGSGYLSDVVDGINWAAKERRANVINMSLGSSGSSPSEQQACDNAWDNGNGVLVVAAAGNEAKGRHPKPVLSYPGAYESVISVAATDISNQRASFSNVNDDVELAAPGVSIPSTYKGGGYAYMSGTSIASPHVAGLGALLMAKGSNASSARNTMQTTATDLGAEGWDPYFGWGLIDAAAATGN